MRIPVQEVKAVASAHTHQDWGTTVLHVLSKSVDLAQDAAH